MVEARQQNGGPQQKRTLAEKKTSRNSTQEQAIVKDTNGQKKVEVHPISVGVGAGAEACVKTPIEKGVILSGKKFYRPPLPYTYKEMELSEDHNDGMEWVFREYGRSLNRAKEPLPSRNDVMIFYVQTNTK